MGVEEVVEDVEGEKKDKKKKSKSEPAPEESPEEDEAATPTATEEKAEEPKAEGAEECLTVFVGGLPWSTEDALWKLFEGCGEISRLKLLTDRETGESKGIAFVDFASAEGVDEAIKKCNQEVEGRAIFVDYSGGKGDGKKGEGKKGDGKKGDGKKVKGKKGKGKKGECSAIRSANQGSIVEATGAKKTFDDSDSD